MPIMFPFCAPITTCTRARLWTALLRLVASEGVDELYQAAMR
jgi:hypothetical protein